MEKQGLTKEEIWSLLNSSEKEIIAGNCNIVPNKEWLLTRIGQAFPAVGLKFSIIEELFKNLNKLQFSEENKWLICFYYDQFLKGKNNCM